MKGSAGVSRSFGRSAIFWSWGGALIRRHVTQEEISWRTAELAPTIQYFSRTRARTCPHPAWPRRLLALRMINVVTLPLRGKIIRCLDSCGILALFNRPQTRSTPLSTNGSRRWMGLIFPMASEVLSLYWFNRCKRISRTYYLLGFFKKA